MRALKNTCDIFWSLKLSLSILHFLHCYVLGLLKKVDRNTLGLVKNQGNLDHVSLRARKSRKILHHSQNWAMKLFCCQVRTNACQISSQSVPTHLPLQIPPYRFPTLMYETSNGYFSLYTHLQDVRLLANPTHACGHLLITFGAHINILFIIEVKILQVIE